MAEKGNVIFDMKPVLRSPYIICGLNGWLNGGDVSVGGTEYLIKQFKAAKFAEMPVAPYHVYHTPGVENGRPNFKMEEGVIRDVYFPKNEFYYAVNPGSNHDLILFLGTEPNLNWEEYANTVLNLAVDFRAHRLCTFGGILDRSPYTKEPRISCTCTSVRVKQEMEKYNVTFSSRQGPASFNLMLLYAARQRDLDAVNFTVRAPYYPEFNIAVDYSPKSIKAVLTRLSNLMGLEVSFDGLNKAIGELQEKLEGIKRDNPQFSAYIDELEKNYVEMPYHDVLDISPNEAVKFAEEFLREHQDRRKDK